MKDKIAFENSVREKSRSLIRARKKRKQAMLYTASSLCVCFIITFGVFLSAPTVKKAFDAAPESAGDLFYAADADYSSSKGSGAQNSSAEKEVYDRLPTYTQAQPSQPEIPSVTEEQKIPSTTHDSPTTEVPVTTAPPIRPEQDKASEKYLKRYATSVEIYSSEIAKYSRSQEEIGLIIDLIFSKDARTEPDGEYTVKVVINTPSEEMVFFLTEEDVASFIK